MCGLAGVYHFRSQEPVSPELLRSMVGVLRHRGPDDEGVYAAGPMGLALRRLAILDLSPAGHQPLSNEDGSVWIAYNGEVYNHLALREGIASAGHRYRSTSDTETLVHLYEELGEGMLQELAGMFAFALWDGRSRRLVLAVDRVGIKPLYYALVEGGIAFASEVKALLRYPGLRRELDPMALDQYLRYGVIPAPRSIFAGVRKLRPGHLLVVTPEGLRESAYWHPSFALDRVPSEGEWMERIRALLRESVAEQLISDVPLGAFLSGGIDSSAVVAYMSQAMDRPVETFSIGFAHGGQGQEFDELRYARAVAERFGTHHHEFMMEPRLVEELPRIVWHFDEPFANVTAVPFYFLCQMAREHITVALAGVGGDELFGGYPRYLAARYFASYARLPNPVRGGLAGLGRLLPPGASEYSLTARARKFLDGSRGDLRQAYLRWVSTFQAEEGTLLYNEEWRRRLGEEALDDGDAFGWEETTGNPLGGVFAFDLGTYLPFNLLAYSDRMSMAHSVEVRVPLCDHRLVELAMAIPPEQKVNGAGLKVLLKKSLRGVLPEEVLRRRKQGFSVPLAGWLRGELAPLLDEILAPERVERRGILRGDYVRRLVEEHRQGRANHANRLWALLVLEVWSSLYLDQRLDAATVPTLAELR